ncbi:hypothetical protein M0805_002965 [Coniferiporia weirii]|nr:hypothetical protein M0805_002965 [Coniferiporia weirii]
MFSKLAFIASLAVLAVAIPAPGAEPASECNTAPVQCCDSVTSAGSSAAAPILASIGVVVQDLNIPVGLTCSPISVVGVGSGATCSENAVCCEDNSHGGLVSIGCVPVDLDL